MLETIKYDFCFGESTIPFVSFSFLVGLLFPPTSPTATTRKIAEVKLFMSAKLRFVDYD